MERRRETRSGSNRWYHLHWPREEQLWKRPKILCVQMAKRPAFVRTSGPTYVPFSMNVFIPNEDTREDMDYICAVLNSRLIWKWLQHHAKRRGVGLEINGKVLQKVPIRIIDFPNPTQREHHDRIRRLVTKLTSLKQKAVLTQSSSEQKRLLRRINTIDATIDQLIYKLYELTDEQITIVEQATVDP